LLTGTQLHGDQDGEQLPAIIQQPVGQKLGKILQPLPAVGLPVGSEGDQDFVGTEKNQ
jgi:hypothetical protein